MNLLDIRDRIRQKAIDAGLTYTEIETLADTNELVNQTMPCLAWQYTGERGTIAEPHNELSLQVYLMTNYYDEIKVESEPYQRDWIITQQNDLRDYFEDWIKELNFESGVTYLEVISYEEIPIAEKLTINGLLSIEFKVNIQVNRGFCLDTESVEYLNQVKVYFNDVLRYTQAANVDLLLTLKDQNGDNINATFTGNNIVVNVGGGDSNISINGDLIKELPATTPYDITVKNTENTEVGIVGIDEVVIPDSELSINGVNVTDIPATTPFDMFTTLNGTQAGTWNSLTNTMELISPSCEWIRPTEWLTLPTVTSSDNILYGLLLIFENSVNQLTFKAGTGLATINYGDGSAVVTSNNLVQSYFYDYATISSAVNVWEDGRNYKQVIVTVTPTSLATGQLFFNQGGTINTFGNNNFVEIVCAFYNNNIRLNLSRRTTANYGRKMSILKIFRCYNTGISTFFFDGDGFQGLRLEIFDIPNDSFPITTPAKINSFVDTEIKQELLDIYTDSQSTFIRAILTKGIRDILRADLTSFQDSRIFKCRNILNISNVDAFWGAHIQIEGTVTITTTSFRKLFQNCNTRKLNIIACPPTPSNVSASGGCFTGMYNLEEMTINGFQVGFDITGSNMSATSLDNLFTSLGTASGSQTIIVTGNPGAATCNTSIATLKGFTVII